MDIRNLLGTLAFTSSEDVLVNFGFLDKGVQNVEHGVRAPDLDFSL